MRRTGYLGMSLFLILILLVAELPGLAQAAQGKQPAPKTQAEYADYTAAYNEKDPAKKAELAEKFVKTYTDTSEMIPSAYSLIISGYVGAKNWPKVMDAADRAAGLKDADNRLKAFAAANAMVAAQNTGDINRVISYGEKVLAISPDDLNTLITLSAVIPQKSPGNKAELDRAAEMATKGLAGIQQLIAKATPDQKPQFVQIDGTLHGTLGLIAYNQQDYPKSIQEYEAAIKDNNKDDAAHFYLAYDYLALMTQASKAYQAAIKAENDAKQAKADQPTIDELAAKRTDLEDAVKKHRDKAIDELAIAVAIGGPVAPQAKEALTMQWMSKNENTNGLEEFIAQKRAALQ
jgi:tetratricopeptide (TPR) repeat protein